jgi:hypothetical protein
MANDRPGELMPDSAVTDADGAFEFNNAPAGRDRLIVRHGTAGWRGGVEGQNGKVINIKAAETMDVGNLEFPPPPD